MVLKSLVSPDLDPLFRYPIRTGVDSAWWEHIPFAGLLIEQIRPGIIVELGTHNGVSFAAFCDAVKNARIPGKCYAIDNWAGDAQAGYYGEDIYKDLKMFMDARHKDIAELIRSNFIDAVQHFEDDSIDLLHIDGLHTYDAVKADFNAWRSKISSKGVVLMHDTNVRQGDFGVHRLWAELKDNYPSFEFLHGHGLGLLALGDNCHPFIYELCNLNETEIATLRSRIASLGARCSAIEWVNRLEKHLTSYTAYTKGLESDRENNSELISSMEKKSEEYRMDLCDRDAQIQLLRNECSKLSTLNETIEQNTRLPLEAVELLTQQDEILAQMRARMIKYESHFRQISGSYDANYSKTLEPSQEEIDVALISGSDLFDEKTYSEALLETDKEMPAALHYIRFGEALGFLPSSKFDPTAYASANPDVASHGGNFLLHYLRYGRKEGRALRNDLI